jgi:DNA repair protein RadD|tara:strand:- start:4098 stop:5639 length:1542 start_codon:yes stop_codon:yes gene_type:complete
MELRTYQQEASARTIQAIYKKENPVISMATGTGKSLIISEVVRHFAQLGRRIWVLTHIQQLVKQNSDTYSNYADKNFGIVCAGMNRKQIYKPIIFGTIQSMIGVLKEIDPPDIIIIDEAHRVPHNFGEPTLYETILTRYPKAVRVAMTATPWRMDNGSIHGKGEEFFFDNIAYKYNTLRGVKEGWLCPLVGVETTIQLDVDDITVNGDFVQKEVGDSMDSDWLESVATTIYDLASERNYIGVYCPTIKTAHQIADKIEEVSGRKCGVLTSAMRSVERKEVLRQLAGGDISVLCSVDMITTGFDFPPLDCIVCLRPTLSTSLWVQIQGRGTRLHPSKKNCLILDFAGNLIRLGGVGMYETFFKELTGDKFEAMPQKPYERKTRFLYPGVTTLKPIDPLTGEYADDNTVLDLNNIHKINCVALKTRYSSTPILMVQYTCSTVENARVNATLFVNTEKPKDSDLNFFENRRLAVVLPTPANHVSYMIKDAPYPYSITVIKKGKYWNVVNEDFMGVA